MRASWAVDRVAHLRLAQVTNRRSRLVSASAQGASDAAAKDTIARLHQQADALNGELRALRDGLALARGTLIAGADSDLVHVNEHLTITALYADRIATKAIEGISDLIHASQHDVLTATPNRALARLRMQQGMDTARASGSQLAAIFIDIDDFKLINDSLGHAVGDQVLVLVARRLESAVRANDLVSRFGGEEFLVVLGQLPDAAAAAAKADSMLAALAEPNEFGVCVSASLGIALFPKDSSDLDELIVKADAAMYRAKRAGGGRYEFHSDDHEVAPVVRHAMSQTRETLDLREANEELVLAALAARSLATRARRSCREQDAFIATVAHELRNPLTPIRIAAGLMVNRIGDELPLHRLQEIIEGQVMQMTRVIDDLIDRSGPNTPAFRLLKRQIDLMSVVRDCAETWRPVMAQRRQRLVLQLPPAEVLIDADAARIRQVLNNLLENAAKYTGPSGVIEVSASSDQERVSVKIADNGMGIGADALPRIFDLLVREERTSNDTNHGHGIGLAVVHDLVEAHGGTATCASTGRGYGSEFVITFPRILFTSAGSAGA